MSQQSVIPPPVSTSRKVDGAIRFFSGVVGVDEQWRPVQESLDQEIRQVFRNIAAALDAEGLQRENIAFARVYLVDFKDFEPFNEQWKLFFQGMEPPARTTTGAELYPPFRIEIDFVVEQAI